eukprot:TRINITY_DN63269_c0_g1_i1.p1 TRINITY_DN63269_c0_g1~~TRINITY_DN63269_c0_g1_i1.p1  ORF type:complete len:109 (-),score=14.97 TRINITY_DN63269_c0_g1_i1:103-429(-)
MGSRAGWPDAWSSMPAEIASETCFVLMGKYNLTTKETQQHTKGTNTKVMRMKDSTELGCSAATPSLGCRKPRTASRESGTAAVSYTHLRAHETPEHLVCRLLLEKKKI